MIGSNNKTGKLEKRKIFSVIGRYTDGFTCYEAIGFWHGKKERSLMVDIDDTNSSVVDRLAKELAKVLRQDKIVVQSVETSIKFIS